MDITLATQRRALPFQFLLHEPIPDGSTVSHNVARQVLKREPKLPGCPFLFSAAFLAVFLVAAFLFTATRSLDRARFAATHKATGLKTPLSIRDIVSFIIAVH
jgi:hypothetical protein